MEMLISADLYNFDFPATKQYIFALLLIFTALQYQPMPYSTGAVRLTINADNQIIINPPYPVLAESKLNMV